MARVWRYTRILCFVLATGLLVAALLHAKHVVSIPSWADDIWDLLVAVLVPVLYGFAAIPTLKADPRRLAEYLNEKTEEWDVGVPVGAVIEQDLTSLGLTLERPSLRGNHALVVASQDLNRAVSSLVHAAIAVGYGTIRTTVDEVQQSKFDLELLLARRVGARRSRIRRRTFDPAVILAVDPADPHGPRVAEAMASFQGRHLKSALFLIQESPTGSRLSAEECPTGESEPRSTSGRLLVPSARQGTSYRRTGQGWVAHLTDALGWRLSGSMSIVAAAEVVFGLLFLVVGVGAFEQSQHHLTGHVMWLLVSATLFVALMAVLLTFGELQRGTDGQPTWRTWMLRAVEAGAMLLVARFALGSYVSAIGLTASLLEVRELRRQGEFHWDATTAIRWCELAAGKWPALYAGLIWMVVPLRHSADWGSGVPVDSAAWLGWTLCIAVLVFRLVRQPSVLRSATVVFVVATAQTTSIHGLPNVINSEGVRGFLEVQSRSLIFATGLLVLPMLLAHLLNGAKGRFRLGFFGAAAYVAYPTVLRPIYDALVHHQADGYGSGFAVALGLAIIVVMLLADTAERRWGAAHFLSFACLLLWFLYQGYADDSRVFKPVPFFLAVGVACLALGSTARQLLDRRPVWRQLSIRSWYGVLVFAALADWGLLWETLCARYGCIGYPSIGASLRIAVQNPILWTIAVAPVAMQLGIWLMTIRDVVMDRVGEPLLSRFFRFAWRRVWNLSWTRVVVPSLAVAAALEASQLRSVGFDASLSDIRQSLGFTVTAVILLAAGWLYIRPVSWTAGLVAVVGLLVLHDATWLYAGILLALLGGPTAALNRRIGRPTWRTTAAAASVAGMFVGISYFDPSLIFDGSVYFFAGVYALMFLFVRCDSDSTDLVWSVRHLRSRRLIRAAFSVALCMASLSALAVSVTYSGIGDTPPVNPLLPVAISVGTFTGIFVLVRGWVSAPWRVLGCAVTARPNLFHRRRHQAEAIQQMWSAVESGGTTPQLALTR